MKRTVIILAILMSIYSLNIKAQCSGTSVKTTVATSIGMVISSNDCETVWNAMRLANYSIEQGDTVSIFLLGKGVELSTLDNKTFKIEEQTETFLKKGGKILACGTCLQSRNNINPKMCTISSMGELYNLIRTNKVVLTF